MTNEIFGPLEDARFSAIANVASGYKQLATAITAEPEFERLLSWARESKGGVSNAVQVLLRIYELASREIDSQVENPYDIALSAYLLALAESRPDYAWLGANKVWHCDNCWWAYQVAKSIRPVEKMRVGLSFRQGPSATREDSSKALGHGESKVFLFFVDPMYVSHHGEDHLEAAVDFDMDLLELANINSYAPTEAFNNYGGANRISSLLCGAEQ